MTPRRTWEVPLETEVTVFGRGSECQAVIESARVSRAHAQVERVGDGFRLRDRGSSNGTWMNGRRLEQVVLKDGDTFTIGDARCVFKAGFTSEDLTIVEAGPRKGKRRPVVFVPGLMGSNLYLGKERVWPNVRLMLTNPDLFVYPGKVPLTPGGVVSEIVVVPNLVKLDQYNRLTEFLTEGLSYETGKDLLEFAYDWRQDVRITARQLGEAIEKWGVQEPITIVAHSLGTLVSRYYVDCLGGSTRVERIVFLGGAHYGVPKSVVLLTQGAGFLPFGILADKVRSVCTSFPTAHQILPIYPSVKDQHGKEIDVLADDRWVPPQQKACHQLAREFRKELPEWCGVSAISIFGYGIKTLTSVTMCRDREGGCDSLDFASADTGDSALPQVTSVLKGTEIHPVRQHHGALYTDKDVQMRLKLELTR
jgi:pSer/pThr/pTyr-binding forkhead associated (FHA) protein